MKHFSQRLLCMLACLSLVAFVACESKSEAKGGGEEKGAAAEGEGPEGAATSGESAAGAASEGTDEGAGGESAGGAAPASAFDGETRPESIPDLAFEVPAEWENIPPTSPMRVAQFKLPGDTDKPSLAVFRFAGGGGTRQANIDRWVGQFQLEGGTAATEADADVATFQVGDLTVTTVYLAGTYVAAMRPGAPQAYNEAGWRMLAAIVEGSGDAFYFKAVGPEATVAGWQPGFDHMLRTVAKP